MFDQWSRRIVCPRTVWKSVRARILTRTFLLTAARARVSVYLVGGGGGRGGWRAFIDL